MDFVLDAETRSLPLRLPYIVVVVNDIDYVIETAGVEIMCDIGRLTAKGRAAGIHLVLTSQRSEAMGDFASIKFNIPMRVAFKTDTEAWSVKLIDEKGAESLLGDGDCLALSKDGLLRRIQTPAISDKEIESVVAEAMRRCRAEKYGATKMIEKRIAIGETDLKVLENECDAKGRHFIVHKLPIPKNHVFVEEEDLKGYEFEEGEDEREAGERLAASYVNFYFTNGAVILPAFGGENVESDREAAEIMKELCPERKIVQIPARDILLGGGNIHCITQQILRFFSERA